MEASFFFGALRSFQGAQLADSSEEDVTAYVERHFMPLGMPWDRIAAITRGS